MTAPSARIEAEDWWQTALIQMESNQRRIYRGGIRCASGN